MGTWVQAFINSPTFLGAGGNQLGWLGGGPINADPHLTQPLPDRNGILRMNYSSGGDCGCGCTDTPMPPGEGTDGVEDIYLLLHWLPVTC